VRLFHEPLAADIQDWKICVGIYPSQANSCTISFYKLDGPNCQARRAAQLHLSGFGPPSDTAEKVPVVMSSRECFLRLICNTRTWVLCLSWGKLKPEEKVNLAIGMTDVCVRICVDALIDQHPTIKREELSKLVRERILYQKQRGRSEIGDL